MPQDPSPTRPALRVVGAADRATGDEAGGRTHVCTWCALRFSSSSTLADHRATSPECRANQKVSSPLQTRYGDADMVWTQPGEATLHRTRVKLCRHVGPRARLVNAAGETIGYQCGWCYSVLQDDLPG
jgi:hypothetical protein